MLLTLTLLAISQEAQSLRPLEAMDLFELEGVTSPTVSPDGSQVLYTRVGFDVMSDKQRREVWLHNVETGDSRPILDGVGSARWSPDGRYIALCAWRRWGRRRGVRALDGRRDHAAGDAPRRVPWLRALVSGLQGGSPSP